MTMVRRVIFLSGVFILLCLQSHSVAYASPADICGTSSMRVYDVSEDEKTVYSEITVCALSFKRDINGEKDYFGLKDIEFRITKNASIEQCASDEEIVTGKYKFDCSDVTSEDGQAKCDLLCPKNYKRKKQYRLVLCGEAVRDYVPYQGNMGLASNPEGLAFHVQGCKVKESRDMWATHKKWNTLYFELEKKAVAHRRKNGGRRGF